MQTRIDSKARLPEDQSLSLLSTKSSTGSQPKAKRSLVRPSLLSSVLSPKNTSVPSKKPVLRVEPAKALATKKVVRKAVPMLALGKREAEDERRVIGTARQRKSKEKGISENQSLNTSVSTSVFSSGAAVPLSCNSSRLNTRASDLPKSSRLSHNSSRSSSPLKPTSLSPTTLFSSLALPITGSKALQLFQPQLTTYEHGEILDYKEVYCLGLRASKEKVSCQLTTQPNNGYDDDRGDYRVLIGDHVAYRYEVLAVLGKGSFGQVLKVRDGKTQELLALKMIRNKSRFHHQAAVEVKLLRYLCDKDKSNTFNIIHMYDTFTFRKHICITFELLTINLYDFIKSNNFQGLSSALIKRFAEQILVCLSELKRMKIIHCDLKPENILLKLQHKSAIKVIDFGSSCFVDERVYTYIQSRFYRAPEIILGMAYSSAIDMWSLGCILAELASGLPLFPGESECEQLLCIMQICGTPPDHILEQATRRKMFFGPGNAPKIVPNKRGKKRYPGTRALSDVLGARDEDFLDFLQSKRYAECFDWDPNTRMTPEEGLAHPWLQGGVLSTTRSGSSHQPHRHHTSSHRPADRPQPSTAKHSSNASLSFLFP